jgi:hypothetical protein
LWQTDDPSPVVIVGKYDGTTFTDVVATNGGEGGFPGCLEPAGHYLYWTWKEIFGDLSNLQRLSPTDANELIASEIDINVYMDVMAF